MTGVCGFYALTAKSLIRLFVYGQPCELKAVAAKLYFYSCIPRKPSLAMET